MTLLKDLGMGNIMTMDVFTVHFLWKMSVCSVINKNNQKLFFYVRMEY